MGVRIALWVTVVNGTAGLAASLFGGWLSDRIGRKPLMIWPRLAFLVATLPVFMVVTHNRNPVLLLALLGGLNLLANLSSVPALVAVTEAMRKDVRSLATATVYATAVAVFGGTTQPIVHWLDETTHNPMAVAWYLSGATVIALVVSLIMPETAKVRRGRG
jgi:MFS family permease